MFKTASLISAVLAGVLGLFVAWGHETARARSTGKGREPAGRTERCLTCHVKASEDPGGAHASSALGCASCHLGNPLAFEKERAHRGLVREAGELSTIALTCGREGCHPREAARVSSSLMARGRGMVAVDRWVFGEIPSPDSGETIQEVLAAARPTRGQIHLRKLCGGCHLGTLRGNRDDAIAGNGSGCAACHVALHGASDPSRSHPPVAARVGDDRCFGCHSRSGRISLSYEGLAEIEPRQIAPPGAPCAAVTKLPDGRPACRHEPDVHRAAGMACTDCHLHTELMGDGTIRAHKEEQVEVTCEACHGPAVTEANWGSVEDPITRDLLRVRGESRPPQERVLLGRRGTPLWNLRPSAPGWTLTAKLDSRTLPVKSTPSDANHRMKGHARLSCSTCHAASAPTCTTCHTRFDPGKKQWDFGAGHETPGGWIEDSEGFGFGPPALGVRADGTIVPAVPGMILDIAPPGGTSSAHRLFAPLEPHATGERARICESCHRSSVALGAGTGTLDLDGEVPAFTPRQPAAGNPSLAGDGWTSLLPETPGLGTRTGFRSLDAPEQLRVLTVGVCLPCHAKASDPIWRDFRLSLSRLSPKSRCPFGQTTPPWILHTNADAPVRVVSTSDIAATIGFK